MTSFIDNMLEQTAVYWPPVSAFDRTGRPILTDPVEIFCHWEDRAEQYIDAQGTTRVSRSVVYLSDQVELGGKLMLGSLDDLPSDLLPTSDAWEIMAVMRCPSIRNTAALWTAFL